MGDPQTRKRAMIRLAKFNKDSLALANSRHDMSSIRNRNPPKHWSSNPTVVPILRSMADIVFYPAQDAKRIPLAPVANAPVAISAGYVSTLSKDLRWEDKSNYGIKDIMCHESTRIFRVADLPPEIDPAQFFPSKVQLHKDQAFGKNNPYKSYSVKPVVSNIAVIL